MSYAATLLGDAMVIDTRSSGLRASQIRADHVAELISERENIAVGRIDVFVNRAEPAGRLHINIRRKDPWQQPVPHPLLDPASLYRHLVPEAATVTEPLAIGIDPETGQPLTVTVWDPDEGGKVIMILSSKGGGKTVLLNCLTERLTACPDAIVIQVNFSKIREDLRWAPACAASALGWDQLAHARRLLQWVVNEIAARTAQLGDVSKIVPSAHTPAIIVKIDELDEVRKDAVCAELIDRIAARCRSEAVSLIGASQTFRAQMVGPLVRAQTDAIAFGRFRKRSEFDRARDGQDLPDMAQYGANKPGVQCVAQLGAGGDYCRGRTFNLEHPPDIARLVRKRAVRDRTPAYLTAAQESLWEQATGARPMEPLWDDETFDGPGPDGPAEPAPPVLRSVPEPAGEDPAAVIRRRTGAIIASITAEDRTPLDPAAAAALAENARARHEEWAAAELAHVTIPGDQAVALLALLDRAGLEGLSSKEVTIELTGDTARRTTVWRWLSHFEKVKGWTEVRGDSSSSRRFYITPAGRDELARLRAPGEAGRDEM
jgi:hypothetical protein